MNRTILHVDMDAFFAAVEQRDNPELRGRPVIVGSDPKQGKGRGIVATCSYEARRLGVHSAQPISRAWRLCPQGVYLRPDMERYARASERIMALLLEFTDLVEQVSVDEAFLDVSGCRRLFGGGEEIAGKVKARILQAQRLTASVGVASNKFVAKVASDLRKPDGLVVVEPGTEREFLNPLPIGRLWGVGSKTEKALHMMGIERIGQLAVFDRAALIRRFGASSDHLWRLAQGLDERPVLPEEGYQSIGHELTFEEDTLDAARLHATLLGLTEKVSRRLRAHGVRCRTITVKLRESDFSTFTRRTTMTKAADTTEAMFPVAERLLRGLARKGKAVRLIGIYASHLQAVSGAGQLDLFDEGQNRNRKLAGAVDDIARRYGSGAITRGSLVPSMKKRS